MDAWIRPLDNAELEGADGVLSFARIARAARERAREIEGPLALIAAPTLTFVTQLLAGLEAGVPVCVSAEPLRAEDLALLKDLDPRARLILWTSGSTGARKAVQLSEKNISAAIAAVRGSLDFPRAPFQHHFLPLHYSFGLIGQLLPALKCGTPTKLWKGFTSFALGSKPYELDGMIAAVPSQWAGLLETFSKRGLTEAPNVTHVIAAGERLEPALRARLREFFPRARVSTNYGMTECASRILSLDDSSPFFATTASGRAVGNFETRVAASGELLVRGEQVMLGYLPTAANADRFTPDGWLRTGDAAKVGPEGLVTVTGRLDELAKVNGELLSLEAQERKALTLAGIRAACAFVHAEATGSQTLVLAVERDADAHVTDKDVLRHLATDYVAALLPKKIWFTESLPGGATGKKSRAAASEEYARCSAASTASA